MEDSTSPVGTRPRTPRLHAGYSNRWATGMWHFLIPGWYIGCCEIYILFVNFNLRNANRAHATASVSTANSCYWNIRTFMKWKIAPPWSGLEPTTPSIYCMYMCIYIYMYVYTLLGRYILMYLDSKYFQWWSQCSSLPTPQFLGTVLPCA